MKSQGGGRPELARTTVLNSKREEQLGESDTLASARKKTSRSPSARKKRLQKAK